MGRLSKFSFPIPGRKNRPTAEPQPEVYAPKAQKILGSTALNVDSSTQWDAKSNSGMSIAVSESTASHHPVDRAREAGTRARSQWGEESETVPSHLKQAGPGPSAYNPKNDSRQDPTEVSSLRKRQSNSTIMSYYDKSRVPLSISQQTSASAMAKGLPTKATHLLDIDGTMSPPVRKSKPAKRDLSNIFSRPRTGGSNNSAPIQDYTAGPSPGHSLTHKASHATLASVKTERDVPRKSTRERLHEFTGWGPPRNPPPEAPVPRMSRKEAMDLNHLYDHYEQMSFRQVVGGDDVPPETADELSEEQQPSREPEIPDVPPSHQYNPSKLVLPSQGVPDAEYATSISSRHTRTSKASKKTTPSFIESDLLQQSVLSLSSDSEDDGYVQHPKPSPHPVRSRSGVTDEEPLPFSERRRSTASKSSANSAKSGKSGKRPSFASRNAYLTIPPNEPLPPCPPEIARRTSSLAHRPSNTPASSLRSSRVSVLSTSTAGSASQHLQDARMMPMPLMQHAQNRGDGRRSETPVQLRRGPARSGEQQTPSLSPKSVDHHMRPAEQDPMNPRFMAVSRQEEMLLSALRMKRARMRGNTLTELEEEEDYTEDLPKVSPTNSDPQDSSAYAAPVRAIQKKGSKSSVSTARTETKSRYGAPLPAAGARTRNMTPPASMAHSEPAGSKKQLSLQCQRKNSGTGHEGAMLYLDEDDADEPSPDLSDFMDFDNGSEETDGQSVRGRDGKSTGDKTPVTPNDAVPSPALGPQKKMGFEGLRVVTEENATGVPRPDSPISPQLPLFTPPGGPRKGVRLSAVGGVAGMEATWWGDDG